MAQFENIGFGTWNRLGDEAYETTLCALETGYRHIDTAEMYENEAEVGRALVASGLPREDVWVTTKVAPEHFAPGQILTHAQASLEKLRLDQVDLFLLHYPAIDDAFEIEDYVGQLAQVHQSGWARNVGVSNFTIRHIDRARDILGDIRIFTNQVEAHPFMQNAAIVDHCRGLGIQMTAYSPLARGKVGDDPVLAQIAAKHGKSPGQIALAFLLAEGFVVIPSSSKPARIAENFDVRDVALDTEDMAALYALDSHARLVDGPWCPTWDANSLRGAA